jgi:hypothetical protein
MTTAIGQGRRIELAIQQRVVLSWSISRPAATGGLAEGSARLEIELPWPAKPGAVVARLVSHEGARQLARAEASWVRDEAASLVHLDAGKVLVASLRLVDDGVDALYARTGLLTVIGVGGGRYDFEGARSLR